jgi:uncharacterized membrane protein
MDSVEIINVLSRWLHIATAIVVVGGTVFIRFVLTPAAERLPEAEHVRLREGIMLRWRKVVAAGIGLFLLSGFYNYYWIIAAGKRRGDGAYHALLGGKIVLSFVVFFLASVLVGRSARFEPLRRQRKTWMTVVVLLAFLIVLIASYLKVSRS